MHNVCVCVYVFLTMFSRVNDTQCVCVYLIVWVDNYKYQLATEISSLFSFSHFSSQLLQKLNLMDYSLLVGIHDCLLPSTDSDEDSDDGDMEDYVSGEEPPVTPTSLTSGDDVLSPPLEEGLSPPKDTAVPTKQDLLSGQPSTRSITISPVVEEIEGENSDCVDSPYE